MMSTWLEMGQHPKKKLPATYGKAGSKPAARSTTDASRPIRQSMSQTPGKDVYDFDGDDFPSVTKTVTKPKPLSAPRAGAKGAAATPAPVPSILSRAPSAASNTTSGGTLRPAARIVSGAPQRGLKRKPSQIGSLLDQLPSRVTSRTSSEASPVKNSSSSSNGNSGSSNSSSSIAANTSTARRKQRSSPPSSPDPCIVVSPPESHKIARSTTKPTFSSNLSSSFSQVTPTRPRFRAPSTPPPKETQKSSTAVRGPSATPTTPRASVLAASTRKAPPSQPVPFRLSSIKQTQSRPQPRPQQASSRPEAVSPRPQPPSPHMQKRQQPQLPSQSQSQPQSQLQSQPRQTPRPQQQPGQRKRRRLIDTLTAQKDADSSDEDDEKQVAVGGSSDEEESLADLLASPHRNARSTPASDGYGGSYMDVDSLATMSPSKASLAPSTPATLSRRATTRRPGIKFTYDLERTMLADEPVALGGASGTSDLSLLQTLLPEPEQKPSAFDFDDDMGGGGSSQGAIQSIHELRQAGANSRHADELVDIMDRIGTPSAGGKPSSARRSALLEMLQQLQEKSFLRHFRDQGAEMKLFRDVGKETDAIAGFSLCCIVITLLSSGSASHRLLREFRLQKIENLFGVLLSSDMDISSLAKERKSNVSVHMQRLLVSLKEMVKKQPIWQPASGGPTQMSPRTMALKALLMYAQQVQSVGSGSDDDGVLSTGLTKRLFEIVASALPSADSDGEDGEDGEDGPFSVLTAGISKDADSVDLYHAMSLLEMHSVSAMQSDIGAEWTRRYIPIIAEALETSLPEKRGQSERLNSLELLVLKLAMNTANNNPEAARYFVDKGLLRRLAEQSCGLLAAVVRSVKTGDGFASTCLDELLLMLGVMINFSENDVLAGDTLVQAGDSALFDRLGKSFLDGHTIAAEADSEETTQINVAFGYLSILLGYLCLHEPVYEAFKKLSPSGSLRPLLDAIQQFSAFYDQLAKTSSGDHGAEANHFTARLRALAHQLEVRA